MKKTIVVAVLMLGFGNAVAVAEPAPDAGPQASESSTDSSGSLTEIVVTAQKRSENLQNVPIAVVAITGSQLQAAGITDVLNLTAVVPGLSFGQEAGAFQPHLRGIGTTSDGPGVENPIATYVDGVYYASQTTVPQDLFDMEQVSVLKGPQGTLFGRNATGGVIQFTTRDPSQTFQAILQSDLDSYLTTRDHMYFSGPVAENLAANISVGYAHQADGWGKNLADGDAIFRVARELTLRSKWLYTPAAETTIKVGFDFESLANSNGLNSRPAAGTTIVLPGYDTSSHPWDTDESVDGTIGEKSGGAFVDVEQGFDFARLVDIAAYRQFSVVPIFTEIASPIPNTVLTPVTVGKEVTEELQLISPVNPDFSWAAGLYYFYSDEGTGPPPSFTLQFLGPLAPTPYSLGQLNILTNVVARSIAGFTQATAKILPDTNLTVGLRYTYEKKEFEGSEAGTLVNGVSIGYLPLPAFAPELTYEKPTWRVALDHKISEDVLAYITYNRGFKSGGYNGFDPTNPPYRPEQLDAYEVGVKSEVLDRRLRVNAAAFYYDYTNIQVTKYTTDLVVYNGAGATLEGLDVDAQAQVSDHFRLSADLEWLHSKFTSFPNAQFSTPLPTGGDFLYYGDAAGKSLPYAADFTATVSADFLVDAKAGPLDIIDINLTDSYNSGYFTESDNFLHQPSFDLLNLSAAWSSSDKKYSATLYAKNLLDKAYLTTAFTTSFQYSEQSANQPRTFGITARYMF